MNLKFSILLTTFICIVFSTFSQQKIQTYNVDSLLNSFRLNKHLDSIIVAADSLYNVIALKEEDISKQAFTVGFLAKKMIDLKELQSDKKDLNLSLVKKDTLIIVDFTKRANKRRLAVVDLKRKKLVYNTVTSHGKGGKIMYEGKYLKHINSKDKVPQYFGNTSHSKLSSLGFMITKGNSPPNNPCHKCKYSIDTPHVCQLLIKGLETGINDSVDKGREIVIHTTGSQNFSDTISRRILEISDTLYRVDTIACYCHHQKDSSSIYASKKLLDRDHYMGRSNGCFVLPEEEHIGIIKTIIKGCLIFCYSDVVNETTNYFQNSPVIKQILNSKKAKFPNEILK